MQSTERLFVPFQVKLSCQKTESQLTTTKRRS